MIIIDKAVWQIDGGVPKNLVVNHFNTVFEWLMHHGMLTEEGIEEVEDGIDDCASLNDELVNDYGIEFLDKCYDKFLKSVKDLYGSDHEKDMLEDIYKSFFEHSV